MRESFLAATDGFGTAKDAWLRAARQESFRRRREDDREAETRRQDFDQTTDAFSVVAGLTDLSIAEMREPIVTRIDWHQTALVQALVANREEREQAQQRLDEMLGEAFVLPDGRRVFRTQDGLRVFDEDGEEVPLDDLDPDMIEDWRPDAESFFDTRAEFEALEEEHDALFAYQEALEDTETKLESGALSQSDLSEIETLLNEAAPDRLRRYLPENDLASLESTLSSQNPPAGPTNVTYGDVEFEAALEF